MTIERQENLVVVFHELIPHSFAILTKLCFAAIGRNKFVRREDRWQVCMLPQHVRGPLERARRHAPVKRKNKPLATPRVEYVVVVVAVRRRSAPRTNFRKPFWVENIQVRRWTALVICAGVNVMIACQHTVLYA